MTIRPAIQSMGKLCLILMISTLSACGGSGSDSSNSSAGVDSQIEVSPDESESPQENAVAPEPASLKLVSTPNPSVLPLLLALANNPDLPVELIPVAGGAGINQALSDQGAEALLSMTWVAAQKRSIADDLQIVSINFWRGFQELTTTNYAVDELADLQGKNLLVSGPVGSGKNGGPDLLFLAALGVEGFDATEYDESEIQVDVSDTLHTLTRRYFPYGNFAVYYAPVMVATPLLIDAIILPDGDDTTTDEAAIASFMVEPAATGIVMNATAASQTVEKSIDIQTLFNAVQSDQPWPDTQLPLGGLSIRERVLSDPTRLAVIEEVQAAYFEAIDQLNQASSPIVLNQLAQTISEQLDQYYGEFELEIPAPVITAAIRNSELTYRTDVSLSNWQVGIREFIQTVNGEVPERILVSE